MSATDGADRPAAPGRRTHVVATAGHVDHGKSALVRALTGMEPDRLAEERRRGLTIDLGFAWTELPEAGSVAFVDVPGHARFVATMVAGVAVIEAALLCVDAREGWRAQTEEHLRILDVVGVSAGLVVATKAALVDAERLAAVTAEVSRRLAGTALAGSPVVACDALEGRGLDVLRHELDALLASRPPPVDRGRPRLWVDRSFTIAGAGTVVTGGLGHGALAAGDTVTVVGSDRPGRHRTARLRGIHALGRTVTEAAAGSRAALNLAGVDHRAVRRGDAVVRPGEWPLTDTVAATLDVFPDLRHDVTRRGAYLVYLGSGEHPARLQIVGASRLAPGATGRVRLSLDRPLPLVPGDRYVLRETGRSETVGGGEVVMIYPGKDPAPEPDTGTGSAAEDDVGLARAELVAALEASRPVGLDVALLPRHQADSLAQLVDEGLAVTVAGYTLAPAWRDELAGHAAVRALAAQPFAPPPLDPELDPAVRRALLRRRIVLVKDGVHFAATALDAAVRALDGLARTEAGFTVSQARQALGTTRRWVIPLLGLLDDAGVTVRRGEWRFLRPP